MKYLLLRCNVERILACLSESPPRVKALHSWEGFVLGRNKKLQKLFDGKSPLAELNFRLNGADLKAHRDFKYSVRMVVAVVLKCQFSVNSHSGNLGFAFLCEDDNEAPQLQYKCFSDSVVFVVATTSCDCRAVE